ncbi:MAG: UvrD-helicase domain-containing protein [Candidatus Latescibacterota bacterium]
MRFVADVHLHSRYARATSRDLSPESVHRWSALKGVDLVGTGDFTHPAWLAELREKLQPAGEGLLELRPDLRAAVEEQLPPACRRPVRFVLSVEISSIYRRGDRTRKVHNLVLLPDYQAADELSRRLEQIGNLRADGRPILGLDSRDLLAICLEVCRRVLFIPAHIWTPHFAVLGASSGFDSLEECFGDLLPHVYAVETGLSSDPPMNWRLSSLDRFTIVSNSDAHSPHKLAREATCFDAELSYEGILAALRGQGPGRCTGTLEFFPEEGKYHWDGHRACGVCWPPEQTRAAGGVCPVCARRLTVGVLHRVEALADRPAGVRPPGRPGFQYLVPLPEVIASALGVGPQSRRVERVHERLLGRLGPELEVLRHAPIEAIAAAGEPLVAEGIGRMRAGQVHVQPGFDGQFGVVEVLTALERERLLVPSALFASPAAAPAGRTRGPASIPASVPAVGPPPSRAPSPAEGVEGDLEALLRAVPARSDLDEEQRRVVQAAGGPLVVVAGPGSGKTRTLTYRVLHLVRRLGVPPESVAAITFTNRAAAEMRARLRGLLGEEAIRGGQRPAAAPPVESAPSATHGEAISGGPRPSAASPAASAPGVTHGQEFGRVWVGTFHRLALDLLAETEGGARRLLDPLEARRVLAAALEGVPGRLSVGRVQEEISLAKAAGLRPAEAPAPLAPAYAAYHEALGAWGARDLDDLLLDLRDRLAADPAFRQAVRRRLTHLLVDEFQDVNAVQYEVVRLLAGDGAGLLVIGDPDQGIYGFRGAAPRFFAQLLADYPQAQVFHLRTNYRSQASVVAAAEAVVAAGGPPPWDGGEPAARSGAAQVREGPAPGTALLRGAAGRSPMVALRQPGPRVRLLTVPAQTSEGIAVVRLIGRMVGGVDMQRADQHLPGEEAIRGGQGPAAVWASTGRSAVAHCRPAYQRTRGDPRRPTADRCIALSVAQAPGATQRSLGDFAVLFRTGRQAAPLEECFAVEGLPYRLVGQRGFLEAQSVQAALAFARHVAQPDEPLRLLQAVELGPWCPARGVLGRLRAWAAAAARGAGGMAASGAAELPEPAARALDALRAAAGRYRQAARGAGPGAFVQLWAQEHGVAGDADLDHLGRLADGLPSLEALLERVLLGREADLEQAGRHTGQSAEAVTLMTLHAAKGLEFPVVFICGVEDGLIPSGEPGADAAEERRLLYVGMTRARDELVLLRARSRVHRGRSVHPEPSPFLLDIPADLLSEETVALPGRRAGPQQLSLF